MRTSAADSRSTLSAGRWPVVTLPGVSLDSLGLYLSALGLLAVTCRQWPTARGCWRQGSFVLVNGPPTLGELLRYLSEVGSEGAWRTYKPTWIESKKKDRGKEPVNTRHWASFEADESILPLFAAHLACGNRLAFNPLFGKGGTEGRRDFAKGWREAVEDIKNPPRGVDREQVSQDLAALLSGEACRHVLGDFKAACWFSAANEIYNSGMKSFSRKGQVTPWAVVLAFEAFHFLAGSASRQLGNNRQARGAFPFVTTAAAPEREKEAGRSVGEFWAPVWERPMTIEEVRALFTRGRAEVDGTGALTPAAFGAAIVQRGVNAGIAEFRRFTLFHTTSAQTFESRLAATIPVAGQPVSALSQTVSRVLALRDRLPADRKKGQSWIYVGLRGPLDEALVRLAAEATPEAGCMLTDNLLTALERVDRNRAFRKTKPPIRFRLFPASWAKSLFPDAHPPCETRLAMAICSLCGNSDAQKPARFLGYRFGMEPINKAQRLWAFPEASPFRRVWAGANLASDLAAVLRRRLVESEPTDSPPFRAAMQTGLADVLDWLDGEVDEAALAAWINRCSLFDWSACDLPRFPNRNVADSANALHAFYAFFRPLFDPSALRAIRNPQIEEPPKAGPLRSLAALLNRGDVAGAWGLARGAYARLGVPTADFPIWQEFTLQRPQRLLAALLVPVRFHRIAAAFRRWQSPSQIDKHEQIQSA